MQPRHRTLNDGAHATPTNLGGPGNPPAFVPPPVPVAVGYTLPPHRHRVAALVIDFAFVGLAIAVAGVLAGFFGLGRVGLLWMVLTVAVIVGGTLGLTAWTTGGTTLGKALLGLEIRYLGGRPIGQRPSELPRLLGRHTLGYLAFDVFFLGSLAALVDQRRRPVHDLVIGYEVVAVTRAPVARAARARQFNEALEAGRALMREQWGLAGVLLGACVKTVKNVSAVVAALVQVFVTNPVGRVAASAPMQSVPVAAPSPAVAGGTAVAGSAVAVTTAIAISAALASPVVFPQTAALEPAVQHVEGAYPLGVPPDMRLRMTDTRTASDAEVAEVPGALAGIITDVSLQLDGVAAEHIFEDVFVPTEVSPELDDLTDPHYFTVTTTSDEAGMVPEGTPIDASHHVDGIVYAGRQVTGAGSLELAVLVHGTPESPGAEPGLIVTWTGPTSCVILDPAPAPDFDPQTGCIDGVDTSYWAWGSGYDQIHWQES